MPMTGQIWAVKLGLAILVLSLPETTLAQEGRPSEEQLNRFLKRFPEADANGDGTLTEIEARAFRDARKAPPDGVSTITQSPPPTRADVAYGPHPRNVLDLWIAPGEDPTPVLIYFHGGSFKAGDKSSFRDQVAAHLQAGISVVSANYRYSSDSPYPGPILDGARVVQFVRSKAAQWNLDPVKIALSGGSAGGTMALWIALHDDLAAPESNDPVARQSTRVCCAVGQNAPCSVEPQFIRQRFGVQRLGGGLYQLFGVDDLDALMDPDLAGQISDASPINHASADDPALFLTYGPDMTRTPMAEDAPQNQWIHHPKFGQILQTTYQELGLECHLYYKSRPAPPLADIKFLLAHFQQVSADRPTGEEGFRRRREIYKATPDRDLEMAMTFPRGWNPEDSLTAIVFFYNGGWNETSGASRQFEEQVQYFSARGMVVARADYREKSQGETTSYKCIEDIRSAVRWLRIHSHELGIDPRRIAAAGGSGSIHLPAAAFVAGEIDAGDDDASIDPLPGAMFLFNPDPDVLDPAMMWKMLGDQAEENVHQVPPTFVFYGSRDALAPHLDELVARGKQVGMPMEAFVGQGGVHGFFKFSPWLEKTVEHMDEKLSALGYLDRHSAVQLPHKPAPPDYEPRVLAMQDRWRERHDAIERERKSQGVESIPRTQYVYKTVGQRQLIIAIHYPPGWKRREVRPACLFFGGGGFNPQDTATGTPHPMADDGLLREVPIPGSSLGQAFTPQAAYFAKRGMVTAEVEYRKRKTDGVLPDKAVEDAKSAMRWVRQNACLLGIDPDRVVSCGGSSGGHLAAAVACLEEFDAVDDDLSISPKPNAVILYYPLLDFLEGGTRTTPFLAALDGNRDLGSRLSPARHWHKDMPPTLVLIGRRDPMFESLQRFVAEWKSADAPIEIFIGEGGHGFSSKSPWLERTTEGVDTFFQSIGYLEPAPSAQVQERTDCSLL